MRLIALLAGAVLALAACGAPDDTGAIPRNTDADDDTPVVVGACVEGEPDCLDDPSNPGVVEDLPEFEVGDVTIADLLDGGPGFPATVYGHVVAVGEDFRVCEALAESFPPQCGGLSMALSGVEQVGIDLQTEGDVSWTDYAVSLYGEVIDDVFVLIEASASGTCLAGAPDCADDPSQGGPVASDPSAMGESTIAEVLAGEVTGPTTVAGFLVATADEVYLCSLLAESLPPICGGDVLPLEGIGEVELTGLPSSQGVTWSDFPITFAGEMTDGVFVVG